MPGKRDSVRVRIVESPVKAILGYSGTIIDCPEPKHGIKCVVPDRTNKFVELREGNFIRVGPENDFYDNEKIEKWTEFSRSVSTKGSQTDWANALPRFESAVNASCQKDGFTSPQEDRFKLGARVIVDDDGTIKCVDGTIVGEKTVDDVKHFIVAVRSEGHVTYYNVLRESLLLGEKGGQVIMATGDELVGARVKYTGKLGLLDRLANIVGFAETMYKLEAQSVAESIGWGGGVIQKSTDVEMNRSEFTLVNVVETMKPTNSVISEMAKSYVKKALIVEPDSTPITPSFDCFTGERKFKTWSIQIIHDIQKLTKEKTATNAILGMIDKELEGLHVELEKLKRNRGVSRS